jgi:hypothetical protein
MALSFSLIWVNSDSEEAEEAEEFWEKRFEKKDICLTPV